MAKILESSPKNEILGKEEIEEFQNEIMDTLQKRQQSMGCDPKINRDWEFGQLQLLKQGREARQFFEESQKEALLLSRYPNFALMQKSSDYDLASKQELPVIGCLAWKEKEGNIEAVMGSKRKELPNDIPTLYRICFINPSGKILIKHSHS